MADTLQKNTGLKKSYLKKGNEEDPIIVAQRFLNIFRQLHIFSPERKEAFNKMVLELAPEIRGIFSSLPGGIILQEYVDDLEQQAGLSGGTTDNSSGEISNSQILASALAGAQQEKKAQMQEPEKPAPVREEVVRPQATAASGKIVADASFAKEFASVFKEAMLYTEANRKKESEQLTKAILSSQNALAKMVLQNNTAAASNSSNNNANNIQINTAATFPPIEDMISGIVKAQSELFREMAKTQTEELSSIISLALKESQQMSTQTIVDAIKAFQKENIALLSMNLSRTPVQEPIVQVTMPQKESFPVQKEGISETSAIAQKGETDINDIPETLTEAEAEAASEEEAQPKKKKKKSSESEATDDQALEEQNAQETESEDGYEYVYVNHEEQLPTDNEDGEEWAWEYEEVSPKNAETPPVQESSPALDTSLFDSDDNGNFDHNTDMPLSDDNSSEDDFEWQYQEASADTEEDTSGLEEQSSPEEDILAEETAENGDWEWEYAEEEASPSSELENNPEINETETFSDEPEEEQDRTYKEAESPDESEEGLQEQETSLFVEDEKETEDFDIQEEFSETENILPQESEENTEIESFSGEDDFDNTSSDLDITEKTEEIKTIPLDNPLPDNVSEETPVWEENPEAESEPQEKEENTFLDKLPETEFVSLSDFDNEDTAPIDLDADRYADEPEDIPEENQSLDASENTEEEWEWEYEEDTDESPSEHEMTEEVPLSVEAVPEHEEEQDWEWEYEEDTEEDSPAENAETETADITSLDASSNSETENTEEEWEWEYEEDAEEENLSPEGKEDDLTEHADDNNGEGEEWEWEYEEDTDEGSSEHEMTEEVPLPVETSPENEVENLPSVEQSDENMVEIQENFSQEAVSDNAISSPENTVSDPYQNLLSDNTEQTQNSSEDIYFQQDILTPVTSTPAQPLFDNLQETNIGIAELDNEENNEPYKPGNI